jgi:hypothetical protein
MVEIEGATEGAQKKKRNRGRKKQNANLSAASTATPGAHGGHPMVAPAFVDLKGYTDWMHGAGYTEAAILDQAAQGIRGFLHTT